MIPDCNAEFDPPTRFVVTGFDGIERLHEWDGEKWAVVAGQAASLNSIEFPLIPGRFEVGQP